MSTVSYRLGDPQFGFHFGPSAPPVALRRGGEEYRVAGVLYRPLIDEDGRAVPARPRQMDAAWKRVVGDTRFDHRPTEKPLLVINHEIWIRTGEPYYHVGVNHAGRLVTAWEDVWPTPYRRELNGIYVAGELPVVHATLEHWAALGYEIIVSHELTPIEVTGEMTPGSTVFREGLRDMPLPDAVPEGDIWAAVHEVALRLLLAHAVSESSRAPLHEYDVARLDPFQQKVANEWVVAALTRDWNLELFDGIYRPSRRF